MLNSAAVLDAESISLELQGDIFDDVLIFVEYKNLQQDVYSIQKSRCHNGHFQYSLLYLSAKGKHWRGIQASSIDSHYFIQMLKSNPSINIFSDIDLTNVAHFIDWLGIDNDLEALLFFSGVEHWLKYDYPKAYLLWLWHKRKNLPTDYRTKTLNKQLLMDVSDFSLTKSQLKNIRKLKAEKSCTRTLIRAIEIIADDFPRVKKWCSHQESINPEALVATTEYPELMSVKWLQPLLKNKGFKIYSLHIEPAMLYAFRIGEELGKTTSYKDFCMRRVCSIKHLYALEKRWENELNLVYRGEELKKIDSKGRLPVNQLLENSYFKKITMVGELRKIAVKLKNCAAFFVPEAFEGKNIYFSYDDSISGEQGLLEVYTYYKKNTAQLAYCCGDFLGYENQEMSKQAKRNFECWFNENNAAGHSLVNDDKKL